MTRMDKKHRVAIIPARGGSRRLPGKNIIPVMGRPALYYPVHAALESHLFDEVIVSTEDAKIGLSAEKSGALVMERPLKLAGDSVGVVDVCLDVLKALKKRGVIPQTFCCIYATAIFITQKDLKSSLDLMENNPDVDVVMGVSRYNLKPLQALEAGEAGFLKPRWPEYHKLQSQGMPEFKASNGTLYWADTPGFLKNKTFYTDHLMGYEIPWIRAIDLDTPEDYENISLLAPLLAGLKKR